MQSRKHIKIVNHKFNLKDDLFSIKNTLYKPLENSITLPKNKSYERTILCKCCFTYTAEISNKMKLIHPCDVIYC